MSRLHRDALHTDKFIVYRFTSFQTYLNGFGNAFHEHVKRFRLRVATT